MNVEEARKLVSIKGKSLQGNADLYGSVEQVAKATADMMTIYGKLGHIANLGHGMHPDHKPDKMGILWTRSVAEAGNFRLMVHHGRRGDYSLYAP